MLPAAKSHRFSLTDVLRNCLLAVSGGRGNLGLPPVRHAVVLGGGLLGVEVASGLATHGVSATVVHSGGHSLKKHSAMAERAMTESGIRFMSKRYSGVWRAPLRWAIVAGLHLRGALKARGSR